MSGRENFKHGVPGSPHSGQRMPPPRPKAGGKKELRADFLLNFQRPPADQRPQQYGPPSRRSAPRHGGGAGSGSGSSSSQSRPAAGKVRFALPPSSFRMLVDPVTPDVVEATLNADAMLDWSSVRCVDLQCTDLMRCPICLEDNMVVPKITRCGHVFCVACIMRYFVMLQEYNGRFWQKCPICNHQQVSPDELATVRFEMVTEPKEGERLQFVLAKRAASSTVVHPPVPPPNGEEAARPRRKDPWHLPVEGEDGWHLSRLAKLRPGRYLRMLAEELEALEGFRAECLNVGDTELLPSIAAASQLLEQLRRDRGGGGASGGGAGAKGARGGGGAGAGGAGGAGGGAGAKGDAHDDAFGEVELPGPAVVEDDALPAPAADAGAGAAVGPPAPQPGHGASPGNPNHLISFYQAADGRLIYLQPLFTRLLLHEHGGSWDKLPESLDGLRLERLHEVTITEETRSRHKFLSHLALGTQVCFAEVDLRSFLSQETKLHFADDFLKLKEQRQREQQKRRRDTRREDRLSQSRAEKEEELYYQSLNRPHPSTVVVQALPTQDDFVPLPGRTSNDVAGNEDDESRGAANGDGGRDSGGEEGSGPTLAQKLKERMAARAKPGAAGKFPPLAPGSDSFPPMGAGSFPPMGAGSRAAAAGSGAAGAPSPPASASAGASSGGSSAWGPGRGSSRVAAPPPTAGRKVVAELGTVPDSWDDDSPGASPALGPSTPMDEQPSFGEALDAAIRSRASGAPGASGAAGAQGSAASDGGAAAAEVQEAGDAEPGGAGAKKKKGRAAKATTIRLFG